MLNMGGRIVLFLPDNFSNLVSARVSPKIFVSVSLPLMSEFISWPKLIKAGSVLRNVFVAYCV